MRSHGRWPLRREFPVSASSALSLGLPSPPSRSSRYCRSKRGVARRRATPGPPVLPHGKDSWEEEEREEESWQRAQANTSDRPYLAIAGDVVFRLGCLSKTASVERGLSQRAHAVGASPEQVRSAAIRAVSEQRREEGLDGFWHTFARILSEQIARPEGPKRKAKASAEA